MLKIAEDYARDHKIGFSTNPNPEKSKTKGIIFSKNELRWTPAKLQLNGNSLPWVKSGKYLGSKLTNILDGFSQDAKIKRAMYIERNCEIIQEFHFAHPQVQSKINRIYNSSFSGSNLWDLSSRNVEMLENSWSVSVRHMWDLPPNSHRYFVEPLGGPHAKRKLISRYVSFVQSAKKSIKLCVQLLLQTIKDDVQTITGKNIRYILDELGQEDIFNVKKSCINELVFVPIDENDRWKIRFVEEMTDLKQNVLFLEENDHGDFSLDEIGEIIAHISTV